ncbi:MAG: Rrf2 family transcriptional regulator [Bacteroidales bacterium]|nr:Rrf2 family transcriptional regulator [Bacteroidales bacterium]
MISNTAKYALRSVLYLAVKEQKDKKIGIKKISKDLSIPAPFLAKILQNLSKHKILSSTKGPHGGFGMGKDPMTISFLDIVEIIDGLDMFTECVFGLKVCEQGEDKKELCPVHTNSRPVRESLHSLFKEQIVGEIAVTIRSRGRDIYI